MAIRPIAIAFLLCLACAPLAAQEVAKTAYERFARLDVNHDGCLSKFEMYSDVFIGALDTDGDHMIGRH